MTTRTAALLLVLSASPCFGGVFFEYETRDSTQSGGEADVIHTMVDGNRIKIDVTGPRGADADMIYRGDRSEMIAVNHPEQNYVVIDEAMIAEISQRLAGIEAEMKKALENVPPEQRAMMEEMMRQRMPAMPAAQAMPTYTVVKTGESGEQNGYPCDKFEIRRDGTLSQTVWVTDLDNVDGASDAVAAFEDFGDFIAEIQAALPDFAQESSVGGHAYEHLDELGGFPVVTIDHAGDGSVIAESRLLNSKSQAFEAGTFEPPANYERMQLMR